MEPKLQVNVLQIPWKDLRVGDLLGEGSYGEVYQGSWHGTKVAIKQLYLKKLAERLREDFKHETKVMAQCSFPQIVRLYGVCMETGHYSIVMEYLSKGSLYQVLQDKTLKLPWSQRYEIAIDTGRGLTFLHNQNILHRDLKSLNVLLDENYRAKIGDFGLAKIKLESSSLKSNKAMGTTRWLAPELLSMDDDAPSATQASDIYSYGMVLWEISAREIPFKRAKNESVAGTWIMNGKKETIPPDCPEVYRLVIETCWKSNPADRPSAGAVVEQLEAAQAALPAPTPLPSLWRSVSGVRKCWQLDEETERQVQAEVVQQQGYQRIPASHAEREKVKRWIDTNPVTAQPYPKGFVPFEGYEMGCIEAIYNPAFYSGFEAHLTKLQGRQGNPVFEATWQSDPNEPQLRQEVDEVRKKLTVHYSDPDYPAVQLLPGFHATKHTALEGICKGGYAALGTTDSGYFGRGYYSTPHAEYAHRVYGEKGVQSYVLLNWVGWYSALPVIRADQLAGKGAFKNYDAHFVPVGNAEFEKVKKYEAYDEKTWRDSINDQGKPPQYVEVVTFDSASCFPAYCIKLNKKPVDPQASSDSETLTTSLDGGKNSDIQNSAVKFFLGDNPAGESLLEFKHWYYPDVCLYLLPMANNQAKCLRVMFQDSGYDNNTSTFKKQLEQLVMLSGMLQRPAVFISKEPGSDNHFICGLVKNNQLVLINPLGLTTHQDCYQVLAELKKEGTIGELWLSSNVLQQRGYEEENLVSCGPIALELSLHILTNFTPETLDSFWVNELKTNEPTQHDAIDLIYYGMNIINLLPDTLKGLDQLNEAKYQHKIRDIRQSHCSQLKTLPESAVPSLNESAIENYLAHCKEAAPAQVVFNALITSHTVNTIHELKEYAALKEELSSETINSKVKENVIEPNIPLKSHFFGNETITPQSRLQQSQTPSKLDTYSSTVFKPSPSPTSKKELSDAEQVEGMSKATKERNQIPLKEVEGLLKWVTEGHLVEVELLLKKNPSVGLCTGTVTDRSDRTFKGITALQYAAWSLDEEMCELVMGLIGTHNSQVQLKALYDNPSQYSEHGDHYDIKPLIEKTQTYVKNWEKWWKEDRSASSQVYRYWQKEVGAEQRKCPAWLIYAWSEEGYDVAWTKQDFSRKIKREYEKHRLEWWFTENCNNGRGVGSCWAAVRRKWSRAVTLAMPHIDRYAWEGVASDGRVQGKLGDRAGEFLGKLKSLSEKLNVAEMTTIEAKQAEFTQTQSPPEKGFFTRFLTDFFNPAPSPTLSPSQAGLNATQQKKQNELVEGCLKGDVDLVKQLESQGVSLWYPNAEGLYPLVAAVYGCSLEMVRYVESQLKEEAVKQWEEVDVKKAKARIKKNTPTSLGEGATYGDVADWYVKHQGSSWCAYYDAACLKHLGYSNWGGWDGGGYNDCKWVMPAMGWSQKSERVRWAKMRGDLRGTRGMGDGWYHAHNGYFERLLDAGAKVDGIVIQEIREQLEALKQEVVTKAKRSSSVVGQSPKM